LADKDIADADHRVLRVELAAGELVGPADPNHVFDAGQDAQFVGQFGKDLTHHTDDRPLGTAGGVATQTQFVQAVQNPIYVLLR
jgi:hypothetical protein